MGVSCPDIRHIIHWGLLQETTRAGLDGDPAAAILYEGKGGQYADLKVNDYVILNIVDESFSIKISVVTPSKLVIVHVVMSLKIL